ncbi:MAG TPA: hypothetical protein VFP13_06060 [Actinomycetota bacterium]|nr:hypothetical protein [Actinomycetota bacterium]
MAFELAAVTRSADLLVGLVLGLCIGLLVAPALRSWQSRREWLEASREAQLTERLLRNLEVHDAGTSPPDDDEAARDGHRSEPRERAPWPTPR